MGITSENVAQRYGVTRREQDQAAVSLKDLPDVIYILVKKFVRLIIILCLYQ